GKISREPELKIEFRIQQEKRRQVEQLIRKHHPYEEPAINFIPIETE
ncbi:MAG: divalent cation tolerance protein CutA, partial [Tissierellia bacterium]|nr:divalent cation tolerance protein CutA [Tissierellia bacterium]